jgi:hypothetical protein
LPEQQEGGSKGRLLYLFAISKTSCFFLIARFANQLSTRKPLPGNNFRKIFLHRTIGQWIFPSNLGFPEKFFCFSLLKYIAVAYI